MLEKLKKILLKWSHHIKRTQKILRKLNFVIKHNDNLHYIA